MRADLALRAAEEDVRRALRVAEGRDKMIARLCLSDLHLGDDRSTLASPDVVSSVVQSLREISGGVGRSTP